MGVSLALLFESHWRWHATGKNTVVMTSVPKSECVMGIMHMKWFYFGREQKMLWNDAETDTYWGGFAYKCFMLWGMAKNPPHQYQNISRFMFSSWNLQQNFKSSSVGTLEDTNLLRGRSNFHTSCLCCLDDKYWGICQRIFQKLYRWGSMWSKSLKHLFITLKQYSSMAVMSHPDVLRFDLQPAHRIVRNFSLACWGQKQNHTVILRVIHHSFDPSVHALNC